MPLKLFNTLGRKKQTFKPLKAGEVKMYNCGLTVYNYAHVGNFRGNMFSDILRRYLEWKGFKVKQVQNFTDVGHMTADEVLDSEKKIGSIDKMEKAAEREHKTVWEIAEFYINAAMKDYKKLNFLEPMARPRATEQIKEIIAMIEKLIENKYAYVSNGSVYFDISKFKNYGKLSGNTLKELKAGAGGRVEENPDKKSPFDFALWINDPKHLMKWKSPWSEGYPGWHIECSVMSKKYLGETIDMHTGGVDNMFPHHECEIAQSESASGKKFVNYWMHVTHLLVDGEKMSKSKGNFYTLKDLEEKGFSAKALRWLLLSAQYRTQLNFTLNSLQQAEATVKSLIDFADGLALIKDGEYNKELKKKIGETKKLFEKSMDDDLNVPSALAAIFELVRETNRAIEQKKISGKNASEILDLLIDFDKVLGVLAHEKESVPAEIQNLLAEREAARQKKDFARADEIRKKIYEMGWVIEDSPSGPRVKRK